MTEDERLAEIQRRIDECRRTRSTKLDLGGLITNEVPDDAFDLSWLEELDISGAFGEENSLTTLPSQLKELKQLNELNCSKHNILSLNSLCFVKQLKILDISNNRISDLLGMDQCSQLKLLDCSDNYLISISGMENNKSLQSLKCSRNKLINLDLSGTLFFLENLGCWDNHINSLNGLRFMPNLKNIDCSFNYLKNLQGLRYVQNLNSLVCANNKIEEIDDVSTLDNLVAFNFSFNQVSSLLGLSTLSKLYELDCSFNNIENIEELSALSSLTKLDCRSNKINTLEINTKLLKLQDINCRFNRLEDLHGFENLKFLKKLDCGSNLIEDINNSDAFKQVVYGGLAFLRLSDNPIKLVPKTVWTDSSCNSLVNYWQELAKGSINLQQLKVQLIGNGRVGKTTLAHAIEHKKAPPGNFVSTHGIALKEIPFHLEDQDQPVTLQLWDFGGQEIYHATHRLFLSKDCLYLLLWAEETDESEDETNHPVSYWLELINDLGGNSPVILVKNQIDRSDKLPERPEGLNNDLPGANQIRDAVKISAMKYRRIPSLRGAIGSIIEELQPRICLELPNSWLAVQAELDTLREQQQRTLPFSEFENLCERAGIEDAQWFANYLHQIGFIFYQANTFHNQLILDQNWVIEAIYKLFDRKKSIRRRIEKAQGRISGDEFEEFWPNNTENEHQIYASFMLNCGVCYEVDWVLEKPFKEREFIIPASLPAKSPLCESWGAERAEDWLLEVQYPFLHRSIIERLISKLDQKYRGTAWRHGVFCTTSDGQVLLQTKLESVKTSNKGSLLFRLRGQNLERLLYELRKLISEASPHNRYQELLTRNGKFEILPEFEENGSMTEPTPIEKKKVKIFISYSHIDEVHRKELDKHLKALGHLFEIEAWNDRQLIAGDQVDASIFAKLNAADVVLLLISPDFIASDYCFKKEMQAALETYEQNKNVIIPIIIRNTPTWFKHRIGQIVALPTDGKHLTKWDDPDDFWADVELGIARRVEHLLKQ